MTDLDRLFAEARSAVPEPGAALLARVLTDAEAVQDARLRVSGRSQKRAAHRGVLGRAVRAAVALAGGWGGVGGLVAATVAGVWIGFGLSAGNTGGELLSGTFGATWGISSGTETQPGSVLGSSDILALAGE